MLDMVKVISGMSYLPQTRFMLLTLRAPISIIRNMKLHNHERPTVRLIWEHLTIRETPSSYTRSQDNYLYPSSTSRIDKRHMLITIEKVQVSLILLEVTLHFPMSYKLARA